MDDKELIVVEGGFPLKGTVHIGGAKNSALKLMAASVMASGETRLDNVPDIADVTVMARVLETIGAKVTRGSERGLTKHTIFIDTKNVNSYITPYELVAKMRASISILGPLITRFGQARVAMPGGCQIGSRGLEMHISGLEALGVCFNINHGYIEATTPNGLVCAQIHLDFPSVGATENFMTASLTAAGTSRIHNAACEPEIADLACFLNKMGAHISGAGTPDIIIEGVPLESLNCTQHTTCGDRIEAGTYLVAAALLGGPLTVQGCDPAYLNLALKKLQQMGCDCTALDDQITVERTGNILPSDIQTLPYPGFPTDLQPQFMVLATLAHGNSIITENVFENRFMCAAELVRMGAELRIDGHHALVRGVDHLSGAPVKASDLRGGAALVLAGLVAHGETTVMHIHHIDRGYEDYVGKLTSCGAHISRSSC